jgi:hypothetical protein
MCGDKKNKLMADDDLPVMIVLEHHSLLATHMRVPHLDHV